MNNEQKPQSLPSASLVQNGVLSAALSVEEGNKLIAEFMGRNKAFDPRDKIYQYHSSWDLLMTAVAKIDSLMTVEDYDNHSINGLSIFAEMEFVYKAVVEFIKWYNNKIKQP